jgi:hypothetical protein
MSVPAGQLGPIYVPVNVTMRVIMDSCHCRPHAPASLAHVSDVRREVDRGVDRGVDMGRCWCVCVHFRQQCCGDEVLYDGIQ